MGLTEADVKGSAKLQAMILEQHGPGVLAEVFSGHESYVQSGSSPPGRRGPSIEGQIKAAYHRGIKAERDRAGFTPAWHNVVVVVLGLSVLLTGLWPIIKAGVKAIING